MTPFELFLYLGFHHVTDLQGYDHMVFLLALCTTLSFSDWRKVVALVSLFTLGHSLMLTLAVLGIVHMHAPSIELLIAFSIFCTGLVNLTKKGQANKGNLKYVLSGVFGLIHGLGFSRYYTIIAEGTNAWVSLPSFTLGIELGQLLVVISVMIFAWLLENAFSVSKRDWNLILTGGVLGISLMMMLERLPDVF